MPSSSNRLFGIEFTYFIATIGCVMYIYLFTIGDKVLSILSHQEFSILLDLFPAVFLFLNGATVTLTMKDKRISRRKLLNYQGKRGSVFFLLGLATCIVWPMNIFIVCGLMYFLAQYLALWGDALLRTLVVALTVLGMTLLIIGVPTSVEYVGPTLQGGNMINFSGFLLFNGYFSIIPWSIFFVAGMVFGRSKSHTKGLIPPSTFFGIGLIVVAAILERYSGPLQELFEEIDIRDNVYTKMRLFFLPFVFYAIGASLCIVNTFLYLFKRPKNKKLVNLVQTITSEKYSILFFQILIGMLTMAVTNSPNFSNKVILTIYVVFATVATFAVAVFWKKRINKVGPVEWLVKRIAGSTKSR